MSEREHERSEFEGWPSATWAGEPDELRRERQRIADPDPEEEAEPGRAREPEPEAGRDAAQEPAVVAGALPEPGPERVAGEQVFAEPASAEPLVEDPEPEPEPELDLAAEPHEEQWADAAAAEPGEPAAVAAPGVAEPGVEEPGVEEPAVEQPGVEEPALEDGVEGPSLEHAGGELDVPSGYTLLEGEARGERRSVGVVVSRFNGGITNRMLETALAALGEAGVAPEAVTVMPVPGAFELPLAAMALAKTRRYACIVALGAIIRGGTPHFEYVATEAASGLQLAQIETGVPVAFGVLTCDTVAQAEERVYKAREAVESALEMADVFARLRATAKSG